MPGKYIEKTFKNEALCNKFLDIKIKRNIKNGFLKLSEFDNSYLNTVNTKKKGKNANKTKKIKKQVILILQSVGDHNRAFDNNGNAGLFTILNEFKKDFDLVYKKVRNLKEILNELEKIDDKQIGHTILMGHGDEINQRFILSNNNYIDSSNYKLFCQKISPKLYSKSSILIHSCCLGKGGISNKTNFSNLLAKQLKGHIVFGSDEEIFRGDLLVTSIKKKSKRLDIEYEIDITRKYKLHKFFYNDT